MGYHQRNYVKISNDSVFDNELSMNRFKQYRKEWESNPQSGIISPFPLNIDIELTNACNLRCPYCARTNNRWGNGNIGFMDVEIAKSILKEIANEEGYCAKFSLRGEPTLYKDLVEILEEAASTSMVDYYFNTNGTLLKESLIDELIRVKLPRISISVAGWDKESYEASQVGADFDSVVKSINYLMNKKRQCHSTYPKVRLQIVLTPDVLKHLDEVKKLWGNLGDEFGGIVYREESSLPISKNTECKNFKCNFLWQRLVVLWNGDVYPCLFHGVKDNNDLKLGNIKDHSLKELWHCEKMNRLRALHQEGATNSVKSCNNCSYRDTEVEKILNL